jgi:2,4-dienoyl-CoA reductase-like NADH-dependent reductase (Old Yellow Enzyme family)
LKQLEDTFEDRYLAGLKLKNTYIKSATFEGMYDDGMPNQKLIDHHVSMAKGGVALTTISYGGVSKDARTFKTQMYINDRSLSQLKILKEKVHKAGGKVSIQLTHCGYFSKNTEFKRPLAPSKVFNEYGVLAGIVFSRAMTLNDIENVTNDFVISAKRLKEIGFDAVELHMGHGYLLSQFLSPWTNKRKDAYGGSIENRARFPLMVFDRVQKEVGKDFPIIVKLNLSDGFKGGFSLEESAYVCKELEKRNCSLVVLSGGFTSKTPFYLMRGAVPLKGMIKNGTSWAEKLTMALFGPMIIKKYAFDENFFLNQAKEIRKQVSLPLAYLGGVDSKNGIEKIVNEGFEFIALARPLIHDSNFLLKLKSGEITKTGCNRCNECIVEMDRGGVKCTIN